jgi:UDP-N-acetylmuramoyl-L-alanyl-D-glutamate--2,6-diaminopimelate ligase
MFKIIEKLFGKSVVKKLRPLVHGLNAWRAAVSYGFPAKKLKVIGITGTKGKTTTTVWTGRLLNSIGIKTGYISTAEIFLGEGEPEQNKFKMTTINPVMLQQYLKQMIKNGCKAVVLEMSSQGMEQNRHIGLGGFDIGVFLNMYPEHIEAHGSWENYIKAKSILFKNLRRGGYVVANGSFSQAGDMIAAIPDDVSHTIHEYLYYPGEEFQSLSHKDSIAKSIFLRERNYPTPFTADFEVENGYVSLRVATIMQFLLGQHTHPEWIDEALLGHLMEYKTVSGRMEFVHSSNNLDILVDYAHEPESMKLLIEQLREWVINGRYAKFAHVISCDGVGRDDWKKPVMGQISYDNADFVVCTTDNYGKEDDPQKIVEILSQTFDETKLGKKFVLEVDRRKAMLEALDWAGRQEGKVLIVSTGVGNEYGLTQPGGKIEWNEKEVWQELTSERNI